jgi:hypothetical protein
MANKHGTSSIFTDDSGSRMRAVSLAIRGSLILLGLGAASLAVSVFGHVALPGLDAPLHVPGANRANPSSNDTDSAREPSADSDAPTGTGKGASSKADSSVGKPTASVKTTGPTATPTTSGSSAAVTPTAIATARPTPPHEPGTPPTAPPGQTKKLQTDQ